MGNFITLEGILTGRIMAIFPTILRRTKEKSEFCPLFACATVSQLPNNKHVLFVEVRMRLILAFLFFFSANLYADADPAPGSTVDQARVDALINSIRQQVNSGNYSRGRLLVLAAQQGNGNACNLLGWMFDNGKGVMRDSVKAREWFTSCASYSPLASYNAGVIYAEGRGVKPDISIAVHYFEQAWKIGGDSFRSSVKQIPIRVGFYFYDTKKAYDKAWRWASVAAQLDSRYGKYLVGRLIAEGHAPPNVNPANALRYLADATEAYNSSAASLLSWLYGTGKFTDKDYALAERYAIQAREMGSNDGLDWSKMLSVDEKNKAEIAAQSWISNHRKPDPLDFRDTLNGAEDQFRD